MDWLKKSAKTVKNCVGPTKSKTRSDEGKANLAETATETNFGRKNSFRDTHKTKLQKIIKLQGLTAAANGDSNDSNKGLKSEVRSQKEPSCSVSSNPGRHIDVDETHHKKAPPEQGKGTNRDDQFDGRTGNECNQVAKDPGDKCFDMAVTGNCSREGGQAEATSEAQQPRSKPSNAVHERPKQSQQSATYKPRQYPVPRQQTIREGFGNEPRGAQQTGQGAACSLDSSSVDEYYDDEDLVDDPMQKRDFQSIHPLPPQDNLFSSSNQYNPRREGVRGNNNNPSNGSEGQRHQPSREYSPQRGHQHGARVHQRARDNRRRSPPPAQANAANFEQPDLVPPAENRRPRPSADHNGRDNPSSNHRSVPTTQSSSVIFTSEGGYYRFINCTISVPPDLFRATGGTITLGISNDPAYFPRLPSDRRLASDIICCGSPDSCLPEMIAVRFPFTSITQERRLRVMYSPGQFHERSEWRELPESGPDFIPVITGGDVCVLLKRFGRFCCVEVLPHGAQNPVDLNISDVSMDEALRIIQNIAKCHTGVFHITVHDSQPTKPSYTTDL